MCHGSLFLQKKLIEFIVLTFKAMFSALLKVRKRDFCKFWPEKGESAVTELLYAPQRRLRRQHSKMQVRVIYNTNNK